MILVWIISAVQLGVSSIHTNSGPKSWALHAKLWAALFSFSMNMPQRPATQLPSRHFCILNNSAQQRKIFWWVLECFDNLELITFYNCIPETRFSCKFYTSYECQSFDCLRHHEHHWQPQTEQPKPNRCCPKNPHPSHPVLNLLIPWIELHQYSLCTSSWEAHTSSFCLFICPVVVVSLASWYSAW